MKFWIYSCSSFVENFTFFICIEPAKDGVDDGNGDIIGAGGLGDIIGYGGLGGLGDIIAQMTQFYFCTWHRAHSRGIFE